MPIEIIQYITYQHNVQQYFHDHGDKYSGVIIPLSIATSFPTGTYGFVRALCARHSGKRYAIDPRTPLFQRTWPRDQARPPHRKMVDILGEPFLSYGLARPLRPSDFTRDTLTEATRSCLDFQMQFQARVEDVRKLKKYKQLLGLDETGDMAELGNPQFLIPPYFLFEHHGDDWYKISLDCLREAVSVGYPVPIRPVVHFGTWPNEPELRAIMADVHGLGIKSLWVYPDNFKEHDGEAKGLTRYRISVAAARQSEVDMYVLFGGYYGILMHYCGLRGFSNGIGYGEWRHSGYHRGGTAMNRIYVPKLHRYLDPPVAQSIVAQDPDYFASDSELLSECIAVGRELSDVPLGECLNHFMECRFAEMQFVVSHPIEDAAQELDETVRRLAGVGPLESEHYGLSLARWATELRRIPRP